MCVIRKKSAQATKPIIQITTKGDTFAFAVSGRVAIVSVTAVLLSIADISANDKSGL
ncbi:hypothetical protein V6984_16145 [Kineothrix sp. IPX-CK]|uniref:Uncharacterized protein n=1 Tax=Kineothrix sedimenti TaxID=3123317 RepID=A0ABZ3EU42_9FIRM